jgi:hypothetical protein
MKKMNKLTVLFLLVLNSFANAQPIASCIEHANMVQYLAKMKNEGLSKSEIGQNLIEISRIKALNITQQEDWMNNLSWLFRPEHKGLSIESLTAKKKQECETDRGIVNWNAN